MADRRDEDKRDRGTRPGPDKVPRKVRGEESIDVDEQEEEEDEEIEDEEEDEDDDAETGEEDEDVVDEVTRREAMHFWGKLFDKERRCTELCDRLFSSIARYISANFDPNDHTDLTPLQLAHFYRSVGGNFDAMFLDQPSRAIAFVYQKLGCLHSLQPKPADIDGREPPSVPALKPRGFVTWERIQLLLAPQLHVPFIQKAVKKYDIIDPDTGAPFPKILPREAFPLNPDPEMVKWYRSSLERLRPGMESADSGSGSDYLRPGWQHVRRDTSGYFAQGGSHSSRPQGYPHGMPPPGAYRGDRPGSRYSNRDKSGPRTPVEVLQDGGRAVVTRVKGFWSPGGSHERTKDRSRERDRRKDRYFEEEGSGRRRSWHGQDEREDERDAARQRYRNNDRDQRWRERDAEEIPTSKPSSGNHKSADGGPGPDRLSRRKTTGAGFPLEDTSSAHSSDLDEDEKPLPDQRWRPKYAPKKGKGDQAQRVRDFETKDEARASPMLDSSAALTRKESNDSAAVKNSLHPRRTGAAGRSPGSGASLRDGYFPSRNSSQSQSFSHVSQMSGIPIDQRHPGQHQPRKHSRIASDSNISAPSNGRRHHSLSVAPGGLSPAQSPGYDRRYGPNSNSTYAARRSSLQNEEDGSGLGSASGRTRRKKDDRDFADDPTDLREERLRGNDGDRDRRTNRRQYYQDYEVEANLEDGGRRRVDRDRKAEKRDPRSRSDDAHQRRIPFRGNGSSSRSRREDDRGEERRRRDYDESKDKRQKEDQDFDRYRERDLRDRERVQRRKYAETGVDGRRYPSS